MSADQEDLGDGLMAKRLVSDWVVYGLTVLAIVGTIAILWAIVQLWPQATELETKSSDAEGGTAVIRGPAEANVLLMIILMGTLGGLLHVVSSFGKYVGNRQFYRSWIVYYLLMPLEGAALAPIIYLMLRVGVLSPASQNGAGSTASLNTVALYGFAGLAGLFANQAIEMLAEVFGTIFKKVSAKDSLSSNDQPQGGVAPGSERGQLASSDPESSPKEV